MDNVTMHALCIFGDVLPEHYVRNESPCTWTGKRFVVHVPGGACHTLRVQENVCCLMLVFECNPAMRLGTLPGLVAWNVDSLWIPGDAILWQTDLFHTYGTPFSMSTESPWRRIGNRLGFIFVLSTTFRCRNVWFLCLRTINVKNQSVLSVQISLDLLFGQDISRYFLV